MIDLTLPGYNFCVPGSKNTHKVPVNVLDSYCMEHDIVYSKLFDAKSRHAADKLLARRAWERFVSTYTSLGERIICLLVYGAMSIKVKLYNLKT